MFTAEPAWIRSADIIIIYNDPTTCVNMLGLRVTGIIIAYGKDWAVHYAKAGSWVEYQLFVALAVSDTDSLTRMFEKFKF